MSKRGKKKAGLQRKVSSVFKQVPIPQHEDDTQASSKPTSDGSCDTPSRSMLTDDSLVSKSSLIKKVCRSENSSGKTAMEPTNRVVTERTALAQPGLQDTPAHKLAQTEDELDKAMPSRTSGIPPKLTTPDDPIPQRALVKEPPQTKEVSDKIESDLIDEVSRKAEDGSISQLSSVDKTQKVENISEKSAFRKKRWIPPKLTIPDYPIAQSPQAKKTEPAKTARDKAESDHTDVSGSEKLAADRSPASRDSLTKKIYQTENTPQTFSPDRIVESPPASKSVESKPPQDSISEKRYGPEAPPQETSPSELPETMVLAEESGPSLWQRINNRLFTPRSGVNSARQKVMVVSIPILAIILIFTFRQVLSKSPQKTQGASTEDDALVTQTDPGHEIDWKIPELLPAVMRDPSKLLTQNNTTQIEEPNQTTPRDKSELINLEGIVYSQDKSSAIVNGRIVHAGDIVSGITVLNINLDSVEFELDGEKWIQKIKE